MNGLPVRGPALVVLGPGKVALQERSATAPGDGEVLIAPHFVGLCGTDLEIVKGELDPAYVRYPVVLGHEWSGRVLAAGPRVPGLAPGDGVVVEGIRPCQPCPPCRSGRTNLCQDIEQLGFTLRGAASPAITAPWHLVHRIAPEVPLTAAALIEPGAVVLRGLSEIDIAPGAHVLVVGDGTIALLAAHLVRLWSPGAVTMAGLRPAQAGLAKAMGVDHFTTDRPATGPYDVVIEAAGSTTAVADAFQSAGRGGRCCCSASPTTAAPPPCPSTTSSTTTCESAAASATPQPPGPRLCAYSTPASTGHCPRSPTGSGSRSTPTRYGC